MTPESQDITASSPRAQRSAGIRFVAMICLLIASEAVKWQVERVQRLHGVPVTLEDVAQKPHLFASLALLWDSYFALLAYGMWLGRGVLTAVLSGKMQLWCRRIATAGFAGGCGTVLVLITYQVRIAYRAFW